MSRLRIAFFGLPLAAWLLHRDGHEIVHAALCRPGCAGERRLRRALGPSRVARLAAPAGVEVGAGAQASHLGDLADGAAEAADVHAAAIAAGPDLVVSWFWTRRLPMSVVSAARFGGVNVHPSLLPRLRGADPIYWAIARGHETTGVTLHALASDYDTGAVYARRELAIGAHMTGWQLARALDRPSLALLREHAAALARGEVPVASPQDEALATDAPALSVQARAIAWSKSTAEVARHVRALAPSPGAWTSIGREPVLVLAAEPLAKAPRVLEPGQAALFEGRAIVRTGDGGVALVRGLVERRDATGARRFQEVNEAELAALVAQRARVRAALGSGRAKRSRR